MLADLVSTPLATPDEILELIEHRSLHGCGCGFANVSLLASALLGDQTLIWTLVKRLKSVVAELNLTYRTTLRP